MRFVLAFALCLGLASCGVQRAKRDMHGGDKPDWDKTAKDALKRALNPQQYFSKARNVVFVVGDGMGISTATAGRFFKAQYEDDEPIWKTQLSWEGFPATGLINTYSTDYQASGSASAATAFLCGEKADTGIVCLNQDVKRGDCDASLEEDNILKSVFHQAAEKGMWTGIVSTATATDATPAVAYSNAPDRKWYADGDIPADGIGRCKDIASQLIERDDNKDMSFFMAGGRKDFFPDTWSDPEYPDKMGRRTDGRNLTQEWLDEKRGRYDTEEEADRKVYYVQDQEEFDAIDEDEVEFVMGLYEYWDMKYEVDRRVDEAANAAWQEPSLADMTKMALKMAKRQTRDEDEGFFLFIEGARIDHAHHDSEPYRSLMDVVAMDAAVAEVLKQVDLEDTLVLVTADHSHSFSQLETQLDSDILGPAILLDDTFSLGDDGKPFTTLGYHNGPGYKVHRTSDGTASTMTVRKDITGVDTTDIHYRFDVQIPRRSSTHSAEDVALYAIGPMSHLFVGQNEQNYIAHAVRYIACLDDDLENMCTDDPDRPPAPVPCGSTKLYAHVAMTLLVATLLGKLF